MTEQEKLVPGKATQFATLLLARTNSTLCRKQISALFLQWVLRTLIIICLKKCFFFNRNKTNLNEGMGIACAGQTRETIAELLLVTKLIFESPTSLGRELPIGSAFF